jgi:hypothetical protein
MKRMISPVLPVPVDGDLKSLIEAAAKRTRLCQADVMRSALRVGVPEIVRRLEAPLTPRRSLTEYLDAFAGLVKPNRELVPPSRFK